MTPLKSAWLAIACLVSANLASADGLIIVRQMKDPALLEYVGRDAFKVRIFPIEPRSNKRIRITYTQWLKDDGGLVEYIYPLNTEKFSSTLIKDVSVKVSINSKTPLKTLYCPSHQTELKRHGENAAVIGYEARDARPDSDFKIVFSRTPNPLGVDLICSRKPGEKDGHFLLLASPGFTAPAAVQPKDICFVLDTSGSMAGGKLDQAKKALKFCLANLNPDDRFEVIRFATEAEGRFKELVPADAAHLAKANKMVDSLKPIGGTAIGEALRQALSLRQVGEERPYLVIFLTDGIPTVGETREDPLVDAVRKDNTATTRIFSFGISNDVNTHLLDRIATETRSFSQYVSAKEDIEVKLNKQNQSSANHTGYRISQSQNYATQARNLNGRTFYQNEKIWSGYTAQARPNIRQVNVPFNSDAYFALLKQHPTANQWLSLGNNLDIVLDDTLYQIRDEG